MITSSDSIKAKLKNKSKKANIPSDTLLKMFMFERFLVRVSKSKYKDNFILKGGFLISSIFGINLRSTMDIDTTIKGLPLNKESLQIIIKDIINVKLDDNCTFEISDIKDIRADDVYNGYEVILKVVMDKLWAFIGIDVTTGDEITYKEVEFDYKTILEQDKISVMTYNNETIIAEKFETILSRGVLNTRMKDYYDLYMFVQLKLTEINIKTLIDAVNNTANRRNTTNSISNSNNTIELIKNSENIRTLWYQYQSKFEYAKDIDFDDVMSAIKTINELVVPIQV